jgi:hypothetical protein
MRGSELHGAQAGGIELEVVVDIAFVWGCPRYLSLIITQFVPFLSVVSRHSHSYIWVQYEVAACHQGALNLTSVLAAVVIRLFEVRSLGIRVLGSQGNAEIVDREGGAVAVLAGGCNRCSHVKYY